MLDIVGQIMSWIIILVEVVSAVILFDSILPKRNISYNKTILYIAEVIALAILTNILANNNINDWVDFIKFPLMYLLITLIFYKGSFILRLGFSVIFYTTLIGIDYFTFLMINGYLSMPNEMIYENPLLLFIGAITSKSIHFFIIITFRKVVFKNNFFEHISNYHWFVYIIQSIITTLALLSIITLSLNTDRIPMIVIISSVGLLFLNIVVFGLLESSAHLGNNIRENALLKQQVAIELDNVKSLSKAFDAQRQSIHDYKHNLGIIYQLLDMHQYQQALNYIQSLSENFYHTLYRIKTDHSIIDAILNLKDIQAKMTGIILDIKAGDLSGVLIPDDLLVTVMCNVLDNAIETCQNIESEKIISVKCVNEDGILIFSVINPVNNPVKIVDNMIETTKKDKTIHGIGLKNVAMALSKCDGDYEIFCDNHKFQFTAFIRLTS